jgi:hypothetical protein
VARDACNLERADIVNATSAAAGAQVLTSV